MSTPLKMLAGPNQVLMFNNDHENGQWLSIKKLISVYEKAGKVAERDYKSTINEALNSDLVSGVLLEILEAKQRGEIVLELREHWKAIENTENLS